MATKAKTIEKKWKKAEAMADRWERTLFMAIGKVRLYRKREKYYRQKFDESRVPMLPMRSTRKIRTEALES